MSARDYAKFGQLFANDGTFNGEQIISKKIDETNMFGILHPPGRHQQGVTPSLVGIQI